jgi:spermidine synthase
VVVMVVSSVRSSSTTVSRRPSSATLMRSVAHERGGLRHSILIRFPQAVIRLSKKYLPGMAISYQHPKVKTHVGDGFKFLADYQNTFDVIITDSSDPEGPAESLFQKPYFELLHGALREGGVITTQGMSSLPPFRPFASPR